MGIHSKDDPILWKTLHSPNEIIFSNVWVTDARPGYWIVKEGPLPAHGYNHSGEWTRGKTDTSGKPNDPSHRSAWFTLDLKCLENVDSILANPRGVKVGEILYDGRDSHGWRPLREAFSWTHGILNIGTALESETTAASTVRKGYPNSIPSRIGFFSVPLGLYLQKNLKIGKRLSLTPKFSG